MSSGRMPIGMRGGASACKSVSTHDLYSKGTILKNRSTKPVRGTIFRPKATSHMIKRLSCSFYSVPLKRQCITGQQFSQTL